MAQSFRYLLKQVKGRVRQNFNTNAIRSAAAVVNITAAEVQSSSHITEITGPGGIINQNFIFHLGDANVWVSNVSPHWNSHFNGEPGGVEFILNVDNSSPLDVAVTITVIDDAPISVSGY